MEEALGERAIVPAAICLGIAGVDRPDDAAAVRGIMRRIGYQARVLVVNDALVALEAGAPGGPGVVIISGTGSIAYGRNAAHEAARAGGWGYVLGDEGSGYWIGRAALRAVLREADRRGPKTALTPLLLRHFGIDAGPGPDARGRTTAICGRPRSARSRSACESAFRAGDSAAIGILRAAANELEASGLTVARRLDLVGEPSRSCCPAASSEPCRGCARSSSGGCRWRHRGASPNCSPASRRPAPSASRCRKPQAARVVPTYKRN